MASQPNVQPAADDGLADTQPPDSSRYSPPLPSYHSRAPSISPNDTEVHRDCESSPAELFPYSHPSNISPASSGTPAGLVKEVNSPRAVIIRDAVGRYQYDPPQLLPPIEPSLNRPHQVATAVERQDPKARNPHRFRNLVCTVIVLLAILARLEVTGTFDGPERQSDGALEEVMSSIFPSYTSTPFRTQTYVDSSSGETITVIWVELTLWDARNGDRVLLIPYACSKHVDDYHNNKLNLREDEYKEKWLSCMFGM